MSDADVMAELKRKTRVGLSVSVSRACAGSAVSHTEGGFTTVPVSRSSVGVSLQRAKSVIGSTRSSRPA